MDKIKKIMNNLSIFDTHCHLANKKYKDQNIKKVLQEAKKVGVKHILNVGN
jgi:Tat protein secretion system quality control protein TatD with DNase activity